MEIENIALFDMDGTLCDYDKGMFESLEKIRYPVEPVCSSIRDAPDYIQNRADMIRSSESWWENLSKFELGWDIFKVAQELEYRIMILTQGPRRNPSALSGKKKWIDKHLGKDFDFTITRDKGLIYGRVFVDDYPEYIDNWLEWRKNGLVIMPANEGNKDYKHPQVIRYDGSNLAQVREAMENAKKR